MKRVRKSLVSIKTKVAEEKKRKMDKKVVGWVIWKLVGVFEDVMGNFVE